MDEATLLRLAGDGDQDAFRELFEAHKKFVFGLAYRYLRNHADAEDVLQETFVKAYRGLESFDRGLGVGFGPWIGRICVNASIDALRHRKAARESALETEEAERMTAYAPGDDPERAARSREIRGKVEEALARLSPRQRMIFTLRHDLGYTMREIAARMDTSEGSVKKQLFRAVAAIKKRLRRFVPEKGYEL
jgi:RNA polymerase sigma-70 factor (ECF subfamily)